MAYFLYKYIKKNIQERQKEKTSVNSGFNQVGQELNYLVERRKPAVDTSPTGAETHNDAAPTAEYAHDSSSIEEVPSRSRLPHDPPTTEQTDEEKRAMRIYRWKLVGGLCLPFSVQALENTVLASSYPFIASDFDQLNELNWIVSAFNLTAATFVPFWGQIADVFGRYAALQSALVIMILGSALCSGAPITAFPMLLAGRGLQGMGSAGLNIIIRTCLADGVSLEENSKNSTIFTIIAAIAYGIGPVIGGQLTDISWRWCFIINLPIGVAGIFLAHILLRNELLTPQPITRSDDLPPVSDKPSTFLHRLSTIDYGGQVLFLFGMGLLVLALTWGGSYYPWSHVSVLVPLILGCILVIAFVIWEHYMIAGQGLARRFPWVKPMIPLKLIMTKNAGILIYINFITGMALYAAFYFVGLYFTLVLNYSSAKAGSNIIYYLPGLAGGAFLAVFACNVFPKQTWWPLFIGTVIEPLGITLLAIALRSQSMSLIYGMLVLTGIGTGIRNMPGALHGVGYYPDHIASIVSLIMLSVSLGGTFGTTILLNIFNNAMRSAGTDFTSTASASLGSINALPAAQQVHFRSKAKDSIALALFGLSSFLWLGVFAMLGLGNVWVKRSGAEGENVTKGSYLGSFFKARQTKNV